MYFAPLSAGIVLTEIPYGHSRAYRWSSANDLTSSIEGGSPSVAHQRLPAAHANRSADAGAAPESMRSVSMAENTEPAPWVRTAFTGTAAVSRRPWLPTATAP